MGGFSGRWMGLGVSAPLCTPFPWDRTCMGQVPALMLWAPTNRSLLVFCKR